MSNMYGYSDYNGPQDLDDEPRTSRGVSEQNHSCVTDDTEDGSCSKGDDDDNYENPLQVGFWMEGDSLAPPCGTAVSTIHGMLEFAHVCSDDILYDLGCGDARVCLEAFAKYHCRATVGVEVEADLVERARFLISKLPVKDRNDESSRTRLPWVVHEDLRVVLERLVAKARENSESETNDDSDLPLPTIIVLYLLPEALLKLQNQFMELLSDLPSPFRILCNTWGLRDMKAEKLEIRQANGAMTSLFLYTRDSLA
jgi:hypothetical protein